MNKVEQEPTDGYQSLKKLGVMKSVIVDTLFTLGSYRLAQLLQKDSLSIREFVERNLLHGLYLVNSEKNYKSQLIIVNL